MRINLGRLMAAEIHGAAETKIWWDSETVLNPHFIVVGQSGSGKTTRLRQLISTLTVSDPGCRFIILDPHGDMAVPGESSFQYSYLAEFGVNPLRIDSDPIYGGVHKRIRHFLATISRLSSKLGHKQQTTLQNLLIDLYAKAGFDAENVNTWVLDYDPRPVSGVRNTKRFPNLRDLRRLTEHKLQCMMLGTSGEAVNALEELCKAASSLQRGEVKVNKGKEVNIGALKDKCMAHFERFLNSVTTGQEIEEVMRYNSQEVLSSVFQRILNLENTGIFKPNPPPFSDGAPVWRHDLSALGSDEQKIMVDTLVEQIFADCRLAGFKANATTYVVIDEAHKYVEPDDNDHIINVVNKEARKFGMGIILSSQSLGHFPDDVVSNSATKMILGVDPIFQDVTARKLKIDKQKVSSIQMHKSALVSIAVRGKRPVWVDLALD